MRAFLNLLPPTKPTSNVVTMDVAPVRGQSPGMLCCRTSSDSAIRHLCPIDDLFTPERHSGKDFFEAAVLPSLANAWDGEDVSLLINGEDAPNIALSDITARVVQELMVGAQLREMPGVFSVAVSGCVVCASRDSLTDATFTRAASPASPSAASLASFASSSGVVVSRFNAPRAVRDGAPTGGHAATPQNSQSSTPVVVRNPPPPTLVIGGRKFRARQLRSHADSAAFVSSVVAPPIGGSALVHLVISQSCAIAPRRTANIRILQRRQTFTSSHFKDTLATIGQYRAAHGLGGAQPPVVTGVVLAASMAESNAFATGSPPKAADESSKLLASFSSGNGSDATHMLLVESSSLDRILNSLELLAAARSSATTTELGNAAADIVAVTHEFVGRANHLQEQVRQLATLISDLHEQDHQLRQRIADASEMEKAKAAASQQQQQQHQHQSSPRQKARASPRAGGGRPASAVSRHKSATRALRPLELQSLQLAEALESSGTLRIDHDAQSEGTCTPSDVSGSLPPSPSAASLSATRATADEVLLLEQTISTYEAAAELQRRELRRQADEAEAGWQRVSNTALALRKGIAEARKELSSRRYSQRCELDALRRRLSREHEALAQRRFDGLLQSAVMPSSSASADGPRRSGRGSQKALPSGGRRAGRPKRRLPSLPVDAVAAVATTGTPGAPSEPVHDSSVAVLRAAALYSRRSEQLRERVESERQAVAAAAVAANHAHHQATAACATYTSWFTRLHEFCVVLGCVAECYRGLPGEGGRLAREWLDLESTPPRPLTMFDVQAERVVQQALLDACVDLDDSPTAQAKTLPVPLALLRYAPHPRATTPLVSH